MKKKIERVISKSIKFTEDEYKKILNDMKKGGLLCYENLLQGRMD